MKQTDWTGHNSDSRVFYDEREGQLNPRVRRVVVVVLELLLMVAL